MLAEKGTVLLQWRNNSSQIETVKTETHLAAVHILTQGHVLWTGSGKVNSCETDCWKKGSLRVRESRKDKTDMERNQNELKINFK